MIPAISSPFGGLGSVGSVGSLGSLGSSPGVGASTSAPPGGFGGALSSAMNSLETTQANATNASQALATGQASDPTAAVTAVENASLSMDLASQLRNKLVDATNTIFQTQV